MEVTVKEETHFYLVHVWGFVVDVMVDILLLFRIFSTNVLLL